MHNDLAVAVNATDHVRGGEHAPVVVVEYGDFQCPHCRAAEPLVRALLEEFDQRVRLVFRHFPLEEVHQYALLAAQAAEAAGAQGKFWEMHDQLLEHQPRLDLNHLKRYAESLGLDMASFIAELDDEVYLQRVREHQQGALASGVQGTPTFFVNGRLYRPAESRRSLADEVGAAWSHAHRPAGAR